MRNRSVALSLEPADMVLISAALGLFMEKAQRDGLAVSPRLVAIRREVSERAMEGQRGPAVGHRRRQPQRFTHDANAKLLSYEQAAGIMGVSVRTIKRRVASGALPVARDGGVVRIKAEVLTGFIDGMAAQK